MPYRVLDLYKDLPQSNCKKCGFPGCFQFATGVFLKAGARLSDCPELNGDLLADLQSRLDESWAEGQGVKPPNSEQALSALREQMADGDMKEMARLIGADYVAGPPEYIDLDLFTDSYRIGREDIFGPGDARPGVYVKIFLFIHAMRSKGQQAHGQWVSFKELPNTISKAQSFEDQCEKLASVFSGRIDDLKTASRQLGGESVDSESADLTILFQVLPKVSARLLFWDGDEDFPARSSILLDSGVFDHLDQEATVFLAEHMVELLEDIAGS